MTEADGLVAADADVGLVAAAAEVAAAASESLLACAEVVLRAESDVAHVKEELAKESLEPATLRDLSSRIPVVFGNVSRLETRVDAVSVGLSASAAAGEARAKRKALIERSAALAEEVQSLLPVLAVRVSEVAEARKAAGNAHFKTGAYEKASSCYTDAVSVDRISDGARNAVYLSNRCACYMALERWHEAAADAREALSLDAGSVKGYNYLAKCMLRLGKARDAATALSSAPLALLGSIADLAATSKTVQDELKSAGNAAFKAGRHGEAEENYTLAIALDGGSPVYYSNRSAVYQARRQWHEAAADASKCIKLDPLFVKGSLLPPPGPRPAPHRPTPAPHRPTPAPHRPMPRPKCE